MNIQRITNAAHVIFCGLIVAFVGLVWDVAYHYTSGVKEGISEFFTVPAHDVAMVGFLVSWIGALMLYRALRER